MVVTEGAAEEDEVEDTMIVVVVVATMTVEEVDEVNIFFIM
jgi:hypothetical protein